MSDRQIKKLETKQQGINPLDIRLHMSMDIVMENYSHSISVLQQNKMHCIGCPLAPFHNIEDAAMEHGLDAKTLLNQLHQPELFLTQKNK